MEVLMDHSGATWAEMHGHLGIPLDAPGEVAMNLYNHLWALGRAGLIRVDGYSKDDTLEALRGGFTDRYFSNRIRASDEWLAMSTALQMNFSARQDKSRFSFLVSPLFGYPQDPAKQTDVFVLMPFADERKPLYENHVVPAIQRLGLTVARADEYLTTRTIMSDVWAGICGCGVVVADCTGRNPNVFYEIGVAHTVGKPVILITEEPEDVPADLRHIRYITIEFTPRGMAAFEERLRKTVHASLGMY